MTLKCADDVPFNRRKADVVGAVIFSFGLDQRRTTIDSDGQLVAALKIEPLVECFLEIGSFGRHSPAGEDVDSIADIACGRQGTG